jgi:hypothetical protein
VAQDHDVDTPPARKSALLLPLPKRKLSPHSGILIGSFSPRLDAENRNEKSSVYSFEAKDYSKPFPARFVALYPVIPVPASVVEFRGIVDSTGLKNGPSVHHAYRFPMQFVSKMTTWDDISRLKAVTKQVLSL